MLADQLWEVPVERVEDAADEIDLIKRAASGDHSATTRLFAAYVAVLSDAVRRYERLLGTDDARQSAFEALLVAIADFDPARADRLIGSLVPTLSRVMGNAATALGSAFSVPPRTVQRFHRILAMAGGNLADAARLAPEYHMPTDTFLAVAEAVIVFSLDAVTDQDPTVNPQPVDPDRAYADATARELVDIAFAAVNDLEGDVCRLAYGFADYDPLPDAEIALRVGLTRITTQRVRTTALTKMRDALAA